MEGKLFAGTQSTPLARALAQRMRLSLGRCTVTRFPDGELKALLEDDVRDEDVVLVHSLLPSSDSLIELRMLADACLRSGARRLTAVLPYFAYARQDRRSSQHESLGGAVMAGLVSQGFSRILTIDLHTAAAEGWFGVPLQHLTALPALAEVVRPDSAGAVVVSPDLGGAKRAEQLARLLGLELAIVHKTRRSGEEVMPHRILGQVRDRPILIVDDVISTGATIEAAIKVLRAEGCAAGITVLTSHALLVGRAIERLAAGQIRALVHTDSVPVPAALPFAHQEVSVAPVFAAALEHG